MSEERKNVVLAAVKGCIEKVRKLDVEKFPDNEAMLEMNMSDWDNFKRDIVAEIIQHENLNIQMDAACGGGFRPGAKLIGIQKRNGFPATKPEDMKKNVDELLNYSPIVHILES